MLNPNQEKFCLEYAKTGNASKAYSKAYGTTKEASARVAASKLLRNPEVAARMKELQAEVSAKEICTAKEIQERLSRVARREESETVYLPNGASLQRQASIRDSVRALELLAKINGMLIAKQEVDFQGVVPVIIKDDI